MSKDIQRVMMATQEESAKISALLRKNRQALAAIFQMELGHTCNISDGEIIADALHSQLGLTRRAARVLLAKQRQG